MASRGSSAPSVIRSGSSLAPLDATPKSRAFRLRVVNNSKSTRYQVGRLFGLIGRDIIARDRTIITTPKTNCALQSPGRLHHSPYKHNLHNVAVLWHAVWEGSTEERHNLRVGGIGSEAIDIETWEGQQASREDLVSMLRYVRPKSPIDIRWSA